MSCDISSPGHSRTGQCSGELQTLQLPWQCLLSLCVCVFNVWVCVHPHVCVCVCMYMYVYVCVYVHVCVCVCVCTCMCMCVCMYMYVCVCVQRVWVLRTAYSFFHELQAKYQRMGKLPTSTYTINLGGGGGGGGIHIVLTLSNLSPFLLPSQGVHSSGDSISEKGSVASTNSSKSSEVCTVVLSLHQSPSPLPRRMTQTTLSRSWTIHFAATMDTRLMCWACPGPR